MTATSQIHISVALDGAGWHPAAWGDPGSRVDELFTGRYWADLVSEAEAGLLDFVTIEDSLGLQFSSDPSARPRGRLDAVLIAARVAPVTSRIGLVPSASVTHTEPFHISKATATLDHVSLGRAGWQVTVSESEAEAALFGRRSADSMLRAELFAEASDYVEVVRRLWDSWEDDAIIRDAANGRFLDRTKVHRIDFQGSWFSMRGPSITPRPPQGQPLVTVLAANDPSLRVAVTSADAVFVLPRDVEHARTIVDEIRACESVNRTLKAPLLIFADLVVFLDESKRQAIERKGRLDAVAEGAFSGDATIVSGTVAELAAQLVALRDAGIDGFRLRPGVIPHDLIAVTRRLVPLLQEKRLFRDRYECETLRGHLGLERPESRYAAASAV